ncbi:MAG: hypothetical protein H6R14_2226 [Proteobacteria bacterium]|nr:hypothetical protein [Pseudomonadota bacterium]
MVRCGQCHAVFNAFDELVNDVHEPLIPEAEEPAVSELERDEQPAPAMPEEASCFEVQPESASIDETPFNESEGPEVEATAEAVPDEIPDEPLPEIIAEAPVEEAVASEEPAVAEEIIEPATPESRADVVSVPEEIPAGETVAEPAVETIELKPLEEPLDESPEQSTEAARQAGLVASRELNETASFNRWSAGTLASDGLGGFEAEPAPRPVWPFALVAILLLVGLLGQLMFYYRTEIALRFPSAVGLYEMASVDIPLPRNAALVSIETSDLQFDNVRGLFVLQATLKNRAPYPQAWPALELSLTDTNDSVVVRRVLYAAEYLPLGTTASAFQPNGEMAVQLWVEAKESGASGYRLYIFYP